MQVEFGALYGEKNVAISGIHTHSGPGGYLQYLLYDITSLGFVRESFDALVDGIVLVSWVQMKAFYLQAFLSGCSAQGLWSCCAQGRSASAFRGGLRLRLGALGLPRSPQRRIFQARGSGADCCRFEVPYSGRQAGAPAAAARLALAGQRAAAGRQRQPQPDGVYRKPGGRAGALPARRGQGHDAAAL